MSVVTSWVRVVGLAITAAIACRGMPSVTVATAFSLAAWIELRIVARPVASPWLRIAVAPVTVADTDFDGKVSLAETLAAADRRFDILDKNADGFITLAELPKTPVQAFAEKQEEQRRKRAGAAAPPPKP